MDSDDDIERLADEAEAGYAMQVRCVHCKREQYALAVYAISCGEAQCSWCGRVSVPMTEDEYRAALKADHAG